MNIGNIWLVASREYSVRVRKKSFIITTFVTPLLLGLLIGLPVLIALWGGGELQKVKVFDGTGKVMKLLESNRQVEYIGAADGETIEDAKAETGGDGLYAVVSITAFDASGDVSVESYSREPLNMEVKGDIKKAVDKAVENYKLSLYGIDGIDEILQNVKSDVSVDSLTLGEDGSTKKDRVEIYMILAYLMSFLIYMFVFLFGNMVMRSVIDEKSSRVVEILVSSVNSVDLMLGKIIGVALVALTQFALWIALTVAVSGGISAAAAPHLPAPLGEMDMTQLAQQPDMPEDTAEIFGVLESLHGINWGEIAVCFLLYFILGYLLYASMFAAIGAACDNETDTGQMQIPVTVPLILGLFIMLHTFEHPGSDLSFWASMIPWTSPMVMLARIPFGVVPAWELAVSIALLALTFLGTAYLSAKIYKTGILMYGKKTTVKDLWKWIKQKE